MRLAVVGGGITGLAAAWAAHRDADVTVYEPDRLGGRILTTEFQGRPVDCGPDAFITRAPAALALCRELGVDGELIAPVAGSTLLWWRGRLRPLPDGLVLGAPRRLWPAATSGILGPWGVVRAGADLVLPRQDPGGDETVHHLVARRFGAQVATRLVDPLVGGIHAGSTEELSAAATVPDLVAAARSSRSLLLGLRATARRAAARAPAAGRATPLFLTLPGGLGALTDRLVTALAGAGVTFRAEAVTAVRAAGRQVAVDPAAEAFDAAVLATPAPVSAALLGAGAPPALAALPHASVAVVTLAYRVEELAVPPGINGILVPRSEGRLMTACSFASAKWPQWAAPGQVVLRVSAGRHRDERAAALDDAALTERLAAEVGASLHSRATPLASRVSRWPGAFPQPAPGHLERLAAAEADLARTLPGVRLAGASYRGVGLPACIASGQAAARSLLGAAAR